MSAIRNTFLTVRKVFHGERKVFLKADVSPLLKTRTVFIHPGNAQKTKISKSGISMISEHCHGNVCILNEKVVPYFKSRDINLLFAILFLSNYKILNFTKA